MTRRDMKELKQSLLSSSSSAFAGVDWSASRIRYFNPVKRHPIHTEQKATGAVETVYIFWRREKSPLHSRNRKPIPQLSPY